jgi:DNA-binding CsgD family transcriptional regulator
VKAYGQCVPGARSTVDHGCPLPASTVSGRDVWTAYEQQGTRVSPVQIQRLTADQVEDLTERSARAAKPRRARKPDAPQAPQAPRMPGQTSLPGKNTGGKLGLDTNEIAAMYATGLSPTEISREFGCAANSIRHQLIKAGVLLRDERKTGRRRAPRGPIARDIPLMVAAYAAGESIYSIAARLGHTKHTVSRHVKDQGQAA